MMRLSRTDTEEDGTLMNTGMTVLSHGIICRKPDQLFGYYAWPSVAALPDGTLIAASSGMRMGHICNFGRVTTFESRDQGATWRGPTVVCDTPLDDRDAGLLSLGGNRLLLSWFNLETKYFEAFRSWREKNLTLQERTLCDAMAMPYNDALNQAHAGSFVRISEDGGITWGDAHRVPVTTPHGPALLPDGSLLFLGKEFVQKEGDGPLFAYRSADEGKTWQYAGQPPLPPQTTWSNFFEPHALALPDGRVLAHLRYQHAKGSTAYAPFTIFQTESLDGGVTWSMPCCLHACGSPPHLLRHSSGVLVCAYGRRETPYGEAVMLSDDAGKTWQMDQMLCDDAPDGDLGYPASVELADGSILTVYYQRQKGDRHCSLCFTRWRLGKV